MNQSKTLNLGYIVESYPTFVVNEILELRRQRENVTVFNAFRPVPEKDPIKDAIRRESIYFPYGYRGVFTANLLSVLRRPVTYIKLALLLWQEKESLRMLVLAAFFAREVIKRNIGHLHSTFGTRTTTLACLMAQLSGVEYSFTTHAYDIFNHNPSLVWKINNASFMRTISQFNKKYIDEEYKGFDSSKIHVKYLGVNLDTFSVTNSNDHAGQFTNISSVGNLIPKKGHTDLIRACKILMDRGYDIRCKIIGTGPLRESLQTEVDSMSLSTNIELLGELSNAEVRRCLQESHIFALACADTRSLGEHLDGIPVALMEAMAMGLPVVSTRLSGIPELIEDDVSGMLVPEKDAVALADALEKLIKDPKIRALLGANARKRIEQHFDLATNTRLLAEMFRN